MNPKLIITEIKFNDQTAIPLFENSITIFVGANNVGKTVALKNIHNLTHMGGRSVTHDVINNCKLEKVGSKEDIIKFLSRIAHKLKNQPTHEFHIGSSVYTIENVGDAWVNRPAREFGHYFIKSMMTENRINYSDSAQSKDFYNEAPTHPIQRLYLDEKLEMEVSSYFRQAFDTDLVVDRFSGSTIYLKVGDRPVLQEGETHLSSSYNNRIRKLDHLKDQGDGMRSFVSILLEMISQDHFSLLIDEPEAFLHPPQAKLLGKLVGNLFKERQIFISTHSSDFIKGIMESANENINIVRISRIEEKNYAALLSNEDIKNIWKDPVLKYSLIIDGLFHHSVIICESDGDCRFFTAIIDAQFEDNPLNYKISDILFVPSHGKTKLPSIVKALRKVAVPTYTICDFDIFNNSSPLKELIEAHEGNWAHIEPKWKIFYSTINQLKSQLDKEEAKKEILKIFNTIVTPNLNLKDIEKIKETLKISTAWSYAKKNGLAFVPAGDAYAACIATLTDLNAIGIYPLRVGELESFDKQIGGSKSKWLEEVLAKDLKNENTLKEGKTFIKDIVFKILNIKT